MFLKRVSSKGLLQYLFLASILLVSGCISTGTGINQTSVSSVRQAQHVQEIKGGGWISVFLNVEQPEGPEISFTITSVELKSNKQQQSLLSEPLTINSRNLNRGQLFVTRKSITPDNYDTLRFTLRDASISGTVQKNDAGREKIVEMRIPSTFNLREGDSHSLFVNWDVLSSIDENGAFAPVMKTTTQAIPFFRDLLYVACPEIDTIYTIRTDRNWVISSLGVEGKPTYMALDETAERLYVLAPEKSMIQVVDIIANKVIDKIYVPTGYQPDFMATSADMQFAYLLDKQGKALVKVDLLTGTLGERVILPFRPSYAISLESPRTLAVSESDGQVVYLLDPDSLATSSILSIGSSPQGLVSWNNLLIVAVSGANLVTSYDLFTNQQRNKINVGLSPRRLLIGNNRLYVSNYLSKSITYMHPNQPNISGEIFLKGKPLELIVSESRRWIYAGDEDGGGLNIIDSTSNLPSGFIDLLTIPLGLVVIN
jgi:DNA-binding beta-propeller fold protein YncE